MTISPVAPLDRARRKAYWRLLPLVFIAYVIAYIDRTNVAIAKLTMAVDLGFDNAVFGLAAGIFFVGYFLLEIPGALIVERWSARKWISRIMITWGLVAGLTAAVQTPGQFYAMRFLLGLAEAGFFPGVIIYLTHWFPSRDRARALAWFMTAQPIAQIISSKTSTPLLRIGTDQPELLGLQGWQWVYIVWAVPAVLFGIVVLFAMIDRPAQARWLTRDEIDALESELSRERATQAAANPHMSVLRAFRHPAILMLALVNFLVVTAQYGVEFFLPTILQRWYGLKLETLAWAILLPFVAVLAALLAVSWNSDRTGERWWHTAIPIYVGGAALLLTPLSRGHLAVTVLLFAVALGIRAYLPPLYALPALFMSGTAAAGGIGLINAFGNLGGFVGPTVLGALEKSTGSFESGIYFLFGLTLLAGTIVLVLRRRC